MDLLAEQESRNTSELFREAFRTYFTRQMRVRMAESRELAQEANAVGHAKEDTHRLVDEARREMKTAQ